uniref:NADH dehydrogenase [ubiquinone] 1 alpha subcomplex subunit 6 n=2 Tax=Hemiselmis andersenii TaxID=464988 RepID=A0A6U4J7G0_HEMAN|mmetsp:Transcript_41474/g.96838  ORF Transcript_41474/g.96838 Transcript_41474/m.96838 type:complete len:142 (+) Transcript_41474:44-469(+)|eukprot:CAMPEP_0114125274 /NCGR_PEP_ID=MMETSP0043_2-20121206/9217_1 /TAXON_ID=464988 /ORGANISM="Hemiselmis andersenii, Strain CCMP644" /LENGTH=141 /DNA_ID=CAMNT_0001218197 /DNA_START=30 /DNA_END=455 /DNA_ORIENTATION=+
MSAPKLSTTLAVMSRSTKFEGNPRDKVLRLYRHVQKSVPYLLHQFAIDEPASAVRANIKREFLKHGGAGDNLDPKIVNMLVFKGQMELDEALAQWKTRTHILKYVYDVVYKPHLARSKLEEVPLASTVREESEFVKRFLGR